MKKIFLFLAALALLVGTNACKCSRSSRNLPDKSLKDQIAAFAPLPSGKELLRSFTSLSPKEYMALASDEDYHGKLEASHIVFALGVQYYDALMACNTHNKARATQLSQTMLATPKTLELDIDTKTLDTDMKELLRTSNWPRLETYFDGFTKMVADSLWQKEEYELYTLYNMGTWMQGINRISTHLLEDYQADATVVLHQHEVLNSLLSNLELMQDPAFTEAPFFTQALPLLTQIHQIILSDTNTNYTAEQLTELKEASAQLKSIFQQ